MRSGVVTAGPKWRLKAHLVGGGAFELPVRVVPERRVDRAEGEVARLELRHLRAHVRVDEPPAPRAAGAGGIDDVFGARSVVEEVEGEIIVDAACGEMGRRGR